jgi:hypothetical protein
VEGVGGGGGGGGGGGDGERHGRVQVYTHSHMYTVRGRERERLSMRSIASTGSRKRCGLATHQQHIRNTLEHRVDRLQKEAGGSRKRWGAPERAGGLSCFSPSSSSSACKNTHTYTCV